MQRRWFLGTMVVGLLASMLFAKPGVVTTLDGQQFTGDITESPKRVSINTANGKIDLDRRNVSKIEYTKSLDDQYTEKHAALAAGDVQGRIELAKWASQNFRSDLAIQALEEARKIDPMNREASDLLRAAQEQATLDRQGGKPAAAPATRPADTTVPAASQPTLPPAAAEPLEHRLLTNDEINIIRQQEMLPDDKVSVRFTNDVIKQYLASGDHDPQAFQKESPLQKANDIISTNDPKMANNVRIATDPRPLIEFRTKVYPLISSGCASSGCHGGTHGGNFGLYPGDSVNAIYTNFYILTSYAKTIKGTQYAMLDRTQPDRSLFLQFDLPPAAADVTHPASPNYRPRFHSNTDAGYRTVKDWLANTLKPIQPDYQIKVSPTLPQPDTAPPAAGQ